MVRYEIEKEMVNSDIDVYDLPKLWNDKMEEFLGVKVTSDEVGILQDTHWSSGLVGYFPGYSLGSAIAAQLYHTLKKQGIEEWIKNEDYIRINEILKENIYQHGKLYTTDELLKRVCGESFNPQYYVDYLVQKYSELYNLV